MNILVVGDVVGPSGVLAIKKNLPKIISEKKVDFVILNGENAANNGLGISKQNSEDFFNAKKKDRVILMTTKASKSYINFKFKNGDTLLFGRESSGVPQKVHKIVNHRIKIPMIEKKRSLNLASSVAIILSENIRQTNYLWTN